MFSCSYTAVIMDSMTEICSRDSLKNRCGKLLALEQICINIVFFATVSLSVEKFQIAPTYSYPLLTTIFVVFLKLSTNKITYVSDNNAHFIFSTFTIPLLNCPLSPRHELGKSWFLEK